MLTRVRLASCFSQVILVCFWGWGMLVPNVSGEELSVSNRESAVDEVDYHPKDGAVTDTNPPGFVWLPEKNAAVYILQCSHEKDFSSVDYQVNGLYLNVHCPAYVFEARTWYWRYTYLDDAGNMAQWSTVRSFTIPEDAVQFPQPSLDTVLATLPEKHPKILLRPEMLQNVVSELKKDHRSLWNAFLEHADQMIKTPIVKEEPSPYPGGRMRTRQKMDIDLWRKNRRIVRKAVEHATNLAFVYLLSGEEKYGERARDWIMAVVSWPADGTTSYRYNDECAMPILSRISRAYTWAYEALSEQDRQKIIETMKQRGQEVFTHLHHRSQHTVRPFSSHNNRAWHFLGEAGIAFIEDIPEAKLWLSYALDVFFNVYPVWGGVDGGWHEGVAYWNSYMSRITWWLDIMRVGFGVDGYRKPFFRQTGDFPFYVNPPGSIHGGFGDSSDHYEAGRNASLMRVFAAQLERKDWMWYAAQYPSEYPPDQPSYEDIFHALLEDVSAEKPKGRPESKIFQDVGIASLHSDLFDPSDDVHFLFKSSPFGTQSHGFNAQNSFNLVVGGIPILFGSGHRDWHGSPHHVNWMWETFSDNSITVNDQGQKKHHPLAKGKIVDSYLSDIVDYVAGDATEAYEGRLKKFVRHAFFIKPDTIILVDDLEAPQPSSFQFHLHSNEPFQINNQFEIDTTNKISNVRIAFASPSEVRIQQTSGCIPASAGFDATQWHICVEPKENKETTKFVTLLKVHEPNRKVSLIVNKAMSGSREIIGMLFDDMKVALVFNPEMTEYGLGGVSTDASMLFIIEYTFRKEDVHVLSVGSTFLRIVDNEIYRNDGRGTFLARWEEIRNDLQKIKPK